MEVTTGGQAVVIEGVNACACAAIGVERHTYIWSAACFQVGRWAARRSTGTTLTPQCCADAGVVIVATTLPDPLDDV